MDRITSNRRPLRLRFAKTTMLIGCLCVCAILLTGCLAGPDLIVDIPSPPTASPEIPDTQTPTKGIETEPAIESATIPPGTTPIPDTPTQSATETSTGIATHTAYPIVYPQTTKTIAFSDEDIVLPDTVILCYDGTMSMMGFVDIHGMNEYRSSLSLVDSALTASFPASEKLHYRISSQNTHDLLKTKDELNAVFSLPFYVNADFLTQPDQVVLQGKQGIQRGMRMNEPIKSFYHALGKPESSETTESTSPASQAVHYLDDHSFLVLTTDLEEIQNTRTLINDIGTKVYANDMVLGITAINSTFSGFAPIWSKGEAIWFEWGAQPTGSCNYMYDYIDYKIGETIDPKSRESKMRPFYILFMGNSDCVNTFAQSLESQLETSDIPFNTVIFETDFSPTNYAMSESIDPDAISIANYGINPLAKQRPSSLFSIQLQGLPANVRKDDTRFIEVPVLFQPRPSDPRIRSFTKDDFILEAYLQRQADDGYYGERMKAAGTIDTIFSVENQLDGSVMLTITYYFPLQKLDVGQYLLTLGLQLTAPKRFTIPSWTEEYNMALSNTDILSLTNGTSSFNGTKTLGLTTFLSGMLEYQTKSVSSIPIGEFTIELNAPIP